MRVFVPIIVLLVGALFAGTGVHVAEATHDPKNFAVLASSSGWNSTVSPSSNPTVTEFRGLLFTVRVEHDDVPGVNHNFALYTKDFPTGSVFLSNFCDLNRTSPGCLLRSATVTATAPLDTESFTPAVPLDDFTGPGGYEYYCEFHRITMHGKIKVLKNPDVGGPAGPPDGRVDIIDVATAAFSFGATAGPPPSSTWNIAVDLDNSGRIDIVDVATGAFYFGKTGF